MSVATEFRQFLLDQPLVTISQICQGFIPEKAKRANGFIYFARRDSEHARTLTRQNELPYFQYFDLEIYHEDIDVVESVTDVVQRLDCYTGAFGAGNTQAFFVESQADDYVPQVQFTDDELMESSFLTVEIRGYTGP